MDLYTVQLVFYTLGIAFMFSLIIVAIVLIYVLIEIKKVIETTAATAREAVEDIKEGTVGRIESLISDNRLKIVGSVGMGLATMLIRKVAGFGKKK